MYLFVKYLIKIKLISKFHFIILVGDHEEETQSNKESASVDQGGDVIRVLEGETEQVADSNDPSPESGQKLVLSFFRLAVWSLELT